MPLSYKDTQSGSDCAGALKLKLDSGCSIMDSETLMEKF